MSQATSTMTVDTAASNRTLEPTAEQDTLPFVDKTPIILQLIQYLEAIHDECENFPPTFLHRQQLQSSIKDWVTAVRQTCALAKEMLDLSISMQEKLHRLETDSSDSVITEDEVMTMEAQHEKITLKLLSAVERAVLAREQTTRLYAKVLNQPEIGRINALFKCLCMEF